MTSEEREGRAARFGALDGAVRLAYLVAFAATGAAIVLLIGQGAYHRLSGRPYDKGRLVATASRQALAALVLLAAALTAVVFMATALLYPTPTAIALSASLLMLAAGTWFVLPLRRRARRA